MENTSHLIDGENCNKSVAMEMPGCGDDDDDDEDCDFDDDDDDNGDRGNIACEVGVMFNQLEINQLSGGFTKVSPILCLHVHGLPVTIITITTIVTVITTIIVIVVVIKIIISMRGNAHQYAMDGYVFKRLVVRRHKLFMASLDV